MKKYCGLLVGIGVLALAATSSQAVVVVPPLVTSLGFEGVPGSTIQFNGSAHSFQLNNNLAGQQWQIGYVEGGVGEGNGGAWDLYGWFTGGPWSYGSVTVNGALQTATVTTPGGSFKIADGTGQFAVGNVSWVQVATLSKAGGVINADAAVNMTGLSYAGENPDLLSLVNSGLGSITLSFQFNPGKTLSQLNSGSGPYLTSYSGSLAPVPIPEAGTVLAGLGAVGLMLWRFRARAHRK